LLIPPLELSCLWCEVKMVTIGDIARKTGLSVSSVAKILRNRPGFSEKTSVRVREVARELGYRPNLLSRALAEGKSMSIGLLAESIKSPTDILRLRAIEAAACSNGYVTYMTGWGKHNVTRLAQNIQDLLSRSVDGLILHYNSPIPQDALELLDQAPAPVVFAGWGPADFCATVRVDDQPAFQTLAGYLHNLGHERAAFVHDPFDFFYTTGTLELLRQALADVGISLAAGDDWLIPLEARHETFGYNVVQENLKNGCLPSVILTHSDETAAAVFASLSDAGVQVPAELSVVGFGDFPVARMFRPALTTIRPPAGELGAAAFEMLFGMMARPGEPIEPVVFESKLVIRESTGGLACAAV
jgi:LacI family transcriptional regulator